MVSLDTYSYNLWMRSYTALSDMVKVEEVLNEMENDDNVDTDWHIYSTLANFLPRPKFFTKQNLH